MSHDQNGAPTRNADADFAEVRQETLAVYHDSF